MIVADALPGLRKEYGIREYSGVRIGCIRQYTGRNTPCSRVRHFFIHDAEDSITVHEIIARLEGRT